MTDDDICGAETASTDDPCQHPAGSCPVPSHGDDEIDENPQGRPSKFTYTRAHRALQAATVGKSKAGCARAAGVGEATLQKWLDDDMMFGPLHFPSAFRRARAQGETDWIDEGRGENGDSSFAKFMLSSSYGYQKSEKREVDMDADHTFDAAEGVTAEFVTYETDGDE